MRACEEVESLSGLAAADKPAHVEVNAPRKSIELETYAARITQIQIQIGLGAEGESCCEALVVVDGRRASAGVIDFEYSAVLAA